MWQIILTSFSAVLFFGFVVAGVAVFGLLSCYSAYGPKWGEKWPITGGFNVWSALTIASALIMVPVLLESGEGNPYQFLGFLAPVSLILVGISPDYQTSKFANMLHQTGAWGAVVFIILYSLAIPRLLWVFIPLMLVASALGMWKKGTLMFWAEMAMYLGTYIILYVII